MSEYENTPDEDVYVKISTLEEAKSIVSKSSIGLSVSEGELSEKISRLNTISSRKEVLDNTSIDSISGEAAYMSHQLQADPRDLSGRMLSGWKGSFNVGRSVYYAVESIEEQELSGVEEIKVLLTVDKCRDPVTGNTSTNVPSGALVIDGFDEILESSDSDAFIQSLTWQAEWQTGLLSRTGDEFDECSGSFE